MSSRVVLTGSRIGCRFLHSGTTENAIKTQILILHEGFPKSEFYAKKALTNEAKNFYNLPRYINWEMPSWLIPEKVGQCMEEYGKLGDVQESIMNPLASSLQSSLLELMPELESVRVMCASPFETPTIAESIDKITQSEASRLIILPLQPHFGCTRSGLLLNEVIRCIDEKTLPSKDHNKIRIVPYTSTEFEISSIERWSTHPVISNLWSYRLESMRSSIDSVLFVAPILRGNGRRDYERSIYASAERTISETRVPLSWRVAFFNGWNQWDLPIRESISSQLNELKDKRVVVIPITSVVPSFDTISVLPRLISSKENIEILRPEVNKILVNGMTEAIKNHILGRRSAQLELKCKMCFRKDCQLTRDILC